jgi:hypothetical protein
MMRDIGSRSARATIVEQNASSGQRLTELVSRADVHDHDAVGVVDAGSLEALANAMSGGCVLGHFNGVVLGRAVANA